MVDAKCYHAVNVACIYTISSTHHTMAPGSLIDHGANGGIAGDDVCIIEQPMRTVHQCNAPVALDTVYSATPAIDGGEPYAHFLLVLLNMLVML